MNQPDADDCGGARCSYHLFPPMHWYAAGTPACIIDRIVGLGSSLSFDQLGAFDLVIERVADVALGIAQSHPCPLCNGDMTANDGVRDGTCNGGARNGLACDVNGTDATFGSSSLDCPPSNPMLTFQNLSHGHVLSSASASLPFGDACDAPYGSMSCACGVCSGDNSVACNGDSDCAALTLGTCEKGANGASRKPNVCSDNTCEFAGGNKGKCDGENDRYCDEFTRADGSGILGCSNNADCNALDTECPNGECGVCELLEPKRCFQDPITVSSVGNNPAVALLSEVSCIPASTHTVTNAVAGFPGPKRTHIRFRVTRTY
jgi:hypothetical protein